MIKMERVIKMYKKDRHTPGTQQFNNLLNVTNEK